MWETDLLHLDCRPKLPNWKAPEICIFNPKRERGDFFHLCAGGPAVAEPAVERLRDSLEMAGELLPLTYNGSTFFLLNVLECANCLDAHRTEWVIGKKTGNRIRILKYHFDARRFTESTLFKIPETSSSDILCVEGMKDPSDEFKAQVETAGLKGLVFEELWRD